MLRIYLAMMIMVAVGCERKKGPIGAKPAVIDAAGIEANNRGVGLMGQFEWDKSIQVFEELRKRQPQWQEARANLAMGYLNRQQEGDSQRAMKLLEELIAQRPEFLQVRYCRGILLLNGGKPAEALKEFQWVAEQDAADGHAHFYVGQCLATVGKTAEALAAYEKAIAADAALRSAYYGAFQCLQQLAKPAEAKARLDEFQRMKDDPRAKVVEFKYTRMGKKAEAIVADLPGGTAAPITPTGPVFVEAKPLPIINSDGVKWRDQAPQSEPRVSITAADIDADGKLDLFIANALVDGQKLGHAVLLRRENGFEVDLKHPLASVELVNAALWGDYDNDGLTDVYFCKRVGGALWKQQKRGEWKDVTDATKTGGAWLDTVDGLWVDADHDGDLDLVLVRLQGPNELLNNNMDGTFRSIAKETGIEGDGKGAIGLIAADLDGDGDVDLMFLKRGGPGEVFLNDRMWRYHKGAAAAASMALAVAVDSDADGQVEIHEVNNGSMLAAVDVSGTGTPGVIVGDEAGWRHGQDARGTCAVWAVVMLEPEKGPSIVGFQLGKPPVVWGPGPGRHPFLALNLSGKDNKAEQMRSNASGIGVSVAARFDSKWAAASTIRNHSGPGQSSQPIAIGLSGAKKADFARIYWPDGLIQTELDLEAGKLHAIAETQRQTSSCPVIFAWDGEKFAFVTDCLGVGGLGFAVGRDEYARARPWENILVPAGLLKARGGRFVVKLSEPMEEVCYLDSISLVRYELPAGWVMTLDERMGVNNPQPTGGAKFYRRSMAAKAARDDLGRDVTEILAKADRKAVDGFELDRRFVGFAGDHWLELEFDRPIAEAEGEPMIVADAWVEYPYSQTMFAAWQAGVAYKAVTVEAMGEDGKWSLMLDQVGYPAGMPRQMSIPLPKEKLPSGTRKIRLKTNQEIYWDRIIIAFAEECPQAKRVVMPLSEAKLMESGFAERKTLAQRRPDYDYQKRKPLWDTRPQEGFYTRFGDVMELLSDSDDALAIFGPGEEVEMEFEATSGEGFYVLEVKGWCKDKDLLTKDGQTVEPIPARDMSNRQRRDLLHAKYNTRYLSGG